MTRLVLMCWIVVGASSVIAADATIPTADLKGSKDHPLVGRYAGSFIVSYDHKSFAEFALPLSRLEEVPNKGDIYTRYYEPKRKKSVEGEYTRIVYLIPPDRSPLEVLRNYEEEFKRKAGTVLFECKEADCGGKPNYSSGSPGNNSLATYLRPEEHITDPLFSNGRCAQSGPITDQRYFTGEIARSGVNVSVLTFTSTDGEYFPTCRAFRGRTIVIVDIIEGKAREQKMVTVAAAEMESAIASVGRVALYGIYFDFNKADLKPESDPTLEQMATLLKGSPALKLLVVGHTDNVGSFASNMELSQRRAAAVVQALVSRFAVAQNRLTAVGVSSASPVASNNTDEGRARNRRVELVDNVQSSAR